MDSNGSTLKNITKDGGSEIISLGSTEVIAISQLSIVFLFGTFGNLLVIYVFAWKKRRKRKRFDCLLLLLGITDLLASLIVPVLFMYGTVTQFKQWHFGYFGCKLFTSLFPVTVTISQGILVLISFERYKSIVDPLSGKLSQRFIIFWMLVTIVIALLLVSPFTYALELVSDPAYGINTCIPSSGRFIILYIYSLGLFFRDFSATCGMIVFGTLSAKALNKKTFLSGAKSTQRRLANAAKARKMLLVVVCVFCICVLPVDIFQVTLYTLIQANVTYSRKVYSIILNCNTFLTILQIANSATNIIIYSKMHKDFTRNLFACARRGNQFMRVSISRMAFRETRSDSLTSFSIADNTTESDKLPDWCDYSTTQSKYSQKYSIVSFSQISDRKKININ